MVYYQIIDLIYTVCLQTNVKFYVSIYFETALPENQGRVL